jgi:hypothetical protein
MSSTIEEKLRHMEGLRARQDFELVRHDVERSELAREVATQRERLRTRRATVLQQLQEQRRGVPRWPSGPKFVATLVDEDEWWAKMLGRKQQAA